MVESSQRVGSASLEPGPGGRIGRYIVLDRLGRGGMGTVFLAYDPELDRRVAVKLLRATKAGIKGRSRLLREAQAMASLSHPNVVSVFDVGALGQRVFITMELVGGGTLDEWLSTRRPWREVVEVFMAAGRGLEAAHAAGLVHRDFKPENVLLTKQGEVRVTDFGLVRRAGPSHDDADADEPLELEDSDADDSQPSARRSDLFSTPLTRAGALLGTPAYMAPEQFLGLTPDARADQFAFCVALFRGLYGVMPYGAEDIERIRERVLSDAREPIPREAKVPAWVREVVERGLAHARDQRWASMRELLDALGRDPRRERVRWAIGAAVVASVLGVGVGLRVVERRAEQACAAEGARVEQSWSGARRAQLGEAMEAVGLEDGARSWALAEAGFDAWARAWSSARAGACRARDPAQAACLEQQLVRFEGSLDALEQPTRLSVAHAVEISAELPAARACEERAGQAASASALAAAEARALQRRLAHAEALNLATRHREALDIALALQREAEAQELAGLVAHAGRVAGQAAHAAADYDQAHAYYQAAFHLALRVAEDRLALAASLGLVWLETDRTRFEHAQHWAGLAETLCARLGGAQADLAQLEHRRGRMLQGMGEHVEAEAAYRRALAHIAAAHGDTYLANVKVLVKLAYVLRMQGEYEEIPALYQRARALAGDSLGPSHPQLAIIDLEQGKFEHAAGRSEQARALLQAAQEGLGRSYGDAHPLMFDTVHSLAMVEYARGNLQAARVGFERAIELGAQAYGADSPRLGQLITNGAVVLYELGRYAEAEAAYLRGRALIEAGYGPDYDGLGYVDSSLGELHMQLGAYAQAELELERAIEIFSAALGPEHVMVSEPLRVLGAGQCERGQLERGLGSLRRALQIAEASDGPDHPDNVGILLALAGCELLAGQSGPGLERLDRARRLALPRADPGSLGRVRLELESARLELLGGRVAEAFAGASAVREQLARMSIQQVPGLLVLDSELLLARAAWAAGEGERAELALARARELLRAPGLEPAVVALRAAALERWLRERGELGAV